MKLHRFYVGESVELKHDFWLHDQRIIYQWHRVLRFRPGQEVVLFDGLRVERLYEIQAIDEREAHLVLRTDFVRQVPATKLYLLWSLLKKDKNDWVLQKATELGVSHFWPILAGRSEKTGFNVERAEKILIEAAEQCGRGDIPTVREPMHLLHALDELDGIPVFVCEQGGRRPDLINLEKLGLLVGPEGGWNESERQLFVDKDVSHISLGEFTLRAETAAVVAATQLIAHR